MGSHDMGPSTINGFDQQCRNCGALDTEIKFALGQECPNAPENLVPSAPVPQLIVPETWEQKVALMQANWFNGYHQRRLHEAFNLNHPN